MTVLTMALLAGLLQAEPVEDAYQAIRRGDAVKLGQLLDGGLDKNAKDGRGVPLLLHAAAAGNIATLERLIKAGADVNQASPVGATALMYAMGNVRKAQMLIDAGADVNAKSKMGKTPFLIAAAHHGHAGILKALRAKGADVQAVTETGSTALHLAADADDLESVKLLLEWGLKADARSKGNAGALMSAATNGNLAMVRLLLSKGADVNVSNTFAGVVRKGPIALTKLSPLHLAVTYGPPEVVKTLLDAGANVNAKDGRGLTPLMLAVATDEMNPKIVAMLKAKGADESIKSDGGETAEDWRRKFHAKEAPAVQAAARHPEQAVKSALELMVSSSGKFFAETGCAGCHHQPVTAMAVALAKGRKNVIPEKADDITRMLRLGLPQMTEALLQRVDIPAGTDIVSYMLLPLGMMQVAGDGNTDAVVKYIGALQRPDGRWQSRGVARPPMEDYAISATALAVHALTRFAAGGLQEETKPRVERAVAWLRKAKARRTEERVMQILGLHWYGAGKSELQPLWAALAKEQRADGGWAQVATLQSDAYATGEVLTMLRVTDLEPATSKAFDRGAEFLLKTQKADGSWFVASRAPKFQPYFESGFPYGHDQWISATATAWAAAGLSGKLPE